MTKGKPISEEVIEHIKAYLRCKYPAYYLNKVVRKSNHPDDEHLYMISAKKNDGTYTVWTYWNEKSRSLKYAYCNLLFESDCEEIFEKFYHRCV